MPCPKCQSTNTKKVTILSPQWRVGAEKCLKCGFIGHWAQFLKEPLRPPGTVELECSQCGWASWFDPLEPEVTEAAKAGAHVCNRCKGTPEPTGKET